MSITKHGKSGAVKAAALVCVAASTTILLAGCALPSDELSKRGFTDVQYAEPLGDSNVFFVSIGNCRALAEFTLDSDVYVTVTGDSGEELKFKNTTVELLRSDPELAYCFDGNVEK